MEGSNSAFMAILTGQSDPSGPPEVGMAIHVDDVALLHVLALDQNKVKKEATGVENFFISQSKSSLSRENGSLFADTCRHCLGGHHQDRGQKVPPGGQVWPALELPHQEVQAWSLQFLEGREGLWA